MHSHTAVDCCVGIVAGLLDLFLMSWLGGYCGGVLKVVKINYKFQTFQNLLWFSNVTCYNL